jgi:hypothetical protein
LGGGPSPNAVLGVFVCTAKVPFADKVVIVFGHIHSFVETEEGAEYYTVGKSYVLTATPSPS